MIREPLLLLFLQGEFEKIHTIFQSLIQSVLFSFVEFEVRQCNGVIILDG